MTQELTCDCLNIGKWIVWPKDIVEDKEVANTYGFKVIHQCDTLTVMEGKKRMQRIYIKKQ